MKLLETAFLRYISHHFYPFNLLQRISLQFLFLKYMDIMLKIHTFKEMEVLLKLSDVSCELDVDTLPQFHLGYLGQQQHSAEGWEGRFLCVLIRIMK